MSKNVDDLSRGGSKVHKDKEIYISSIQPQKWVRRNLLPGPSSKFSNNRRRKWTPSYTERNKVRSPLRLVIDIFRHSRPSKNVKNCRKKSKKGRKLDIVCFFLKGHKSEFLMLRYLALKFFGSLNML